MQDSIILSLKIRYLLAVSNFRLGQLDFDAAGLQVSEYEEADLRLSPCFWFVILDNNLLFSGSALWWKWQFN